MRLIHIEVIAEIRVNAGATTILDSVITDRRNPATLADGQTEVKCLRIWRDWL